MCIVLNMWFETLGGRNWIVFAVIWNGLEAAKVFVKLLQWKIDYWITIDAVFHSLHWCVNLCLEFANSIKVWCLVQNFGAVNVVFQNSSS